MNVKKFTANSSREALRLVRDALGPDAVILSNRNLNGCVEIMAMAGDDMSSLASTVIERNVPPAIERKAPPAIEREAPTNRTLVAELAAKKRAQSEQGMRRSQFEETIPSAPAMAPVMTSPATSLAQEAAEMEMRKMMSEIRSMRDMLETQLSEITWSSQQQREPAKAGILREMLAAGFSASLARYLIDRLPEQEKANGGMRWVQTVLARNLNTIGNENQMLEQGGVYALVGPTGVGKTTTTAKLAARSVMMHGASKLALITTDGYRIGGFEQLRIYGKILGVMVHSVKDLADLRIALDELKGKHTVLIDTVGVGQHDKMVEEQVAMLSETGTPVKRLLCLPATSTGETLNEVVRAYKGDGLAGCIMTKLDEAATIGNVLDVIIRQKLVLYYVANGQRVPEDLHVANRQYLVDRAFKLKRETAAFRFKDEELPLVVANSSRVMNDKSLREVMFG